MKTYIELKNQFVGHHRFVNVKEAFPSADSIHHLENWHRHVFKVTTSIEVLNEDRELEFFIVQSQIQNYLNKTFHNKKFELSCEAIARMILTQIISEYGQARFIRVKVSEDGENAGIVEQGGVV